MTYTPMPSDVGFPSNETAGGQVDRLAMSKALLNSGRSSLPDKEVYFQAKRSLDTLFNMKLDIVNLANELSKLNDSLPEVRRVLVTLEGLLNGVVEAEFNLVSTINKSFTQQIALRIAKMKPTETNES